MKSFLVTPASRLKGEISLLGDKSMAHRAIILSAVAQGKTRIENFPANQDCLYTLAAFRKLGIRVISQSLKTNKKCLVITVFGRGLFGLRKPNTPIFVGDSGTTLRLLLGVLAGQNFSVKLTADKSLSQRPMLRVTKPLRMMGANIVARRPSPVARQEEYPPITIKGGGLKPITYKMPVASAQVKSAILLAGLYAKGKTAVFEPTATRDHTERMLNLFEAKIEVKPHRIVIRGDKELVSPKKIYIPGDISSASFFIVAASILPASEITIKNVGLNPSRMGIIKVLRRMAANIKITTYDLRLTTYEPTGDIIVKSSKLKGTVVRKDEIPSLIDELPILMVAACFAKGKTIFKGVSELRVKETDRLRSMSDNLKKMGANIQIIKTGVLEKIIIQGVRELTASHVRTFKDHRTAMSMVVAGLLAKGETFIDDIRCIEKSFPNFFNVLKPLIE